MEKLRKKIKERWRWFGLGEGLRARQSSCGLGLGNALQLPKQDLASAVRVVPAPEACTVRRMCGRAAPDHHDYPARVQNLPSAEVEGFCR